ncbi:substrate-binding protein [Pseudooceanicola nanhaiensis]|jgi:branched-chain amino acid transport system substrate-binding protein|uniref:Substrate-binding protein n=1 Tax=Pseudooceanicola nanhaiensis TaxID=375761 RepID=A0A917T7E8_9RHOB|nr:ABC transporter substrate-binding protein [Pseudooceanicola nanhaiensis]GGM12345.1 substrate-binding protein [Pseudooceanicola nanhaiensis]
MKYLKTPGRLATLLAATALGAPQVHAEISDNVIKIGVMNDQSGPYADNCGAGSVASVKLAIEDHGGSVNGTPVEVLIADDQNKPDIGVAQALKWVESEGVDAIVGCSASSIALAVQDVMKENEKPYLIAGTASSDTTNAKCSPFGTNWAYDTYTLAKGSVMAQLEQGLDTWYFITVDYTFGKQWQDDATRFIEENGGTVMGSVLHPLGATDFSSQLLQAQASGAKVIGIANAGSDLANVIKQAREFGIAESGQKLAPLGMQVNNVHGIGLEAMQGLIASAPAYWDENDETRAYTERYTAMLGSDRKPNESQTVTYSAVNHYLKAVEAAGSDAGPAVMAAMREMPVNDVFTHDATIREDGVVLRDMLQVQVKTPEDSQYPWDYYKILGTLPAEDVWRPMSESECSLVSK